MSLYEPVEFINTFLKDKLEWRQVRDSVAIHVPCTSKKLGVTSAFEQVAGLCAKEVTPSGIPCCGEALLSRSPDSTTCDYGVPRMSARIRLLAFKQLLLALSALQKCSWCHDDDVGNGNTVYKNSTFAKYLALLLVRPLGTQSCVVAWDQVASLSLSDTRRTDGLLRPDMGVASIQFLTSETKRRIPLAF